MQNGYVKIYRKLLDNPIITKDADYLAVWVYLLLNATHKEIDALFKGKRITLQPGQLITGSKAISRKLKINYVKVFRIISEYESEHQIEKQKSNKNTLISIVNWQDYQVNEKQNEIQMKYKCNSNEIQVKTNKNNKNIKNNNNMNIIIYNWDKNLQCQAINKSNNIKCSRRSSYEINGKCYCNQHSRDVIKDVLHYKNNLDNNLPEWFDKDYVKDQTNLKEMEEVLSDFK